MIKKTHFIIIALIALIAFITMPVQAYTLIGTKDTTAFFNGDAAFSDIYFTCGPASCFPQIEANITYITGENFGIWQNNGAKSLSGSQSVSLYESTTNNIVGNGTFTWDINGGYSSVTKDDEWTLSITDFSDTGLETKYAFYISPAPADATWLMTNVGRFSDTTAAGGSVVNTMMSYAATGGKISYGIVKTYGGTSVIAPVTSFSCTPTSQYPDQDVVCTDTSTNAPTDWLWSIDMEGAGIDGWTTSTSRNLTWQSHYPGLYSVNLRANNSAGSDWENKSSYVSISVNATPNTCDQEPTAGWSRTKFRCMNPSNDASIFGCNIQLNDLEGGSWSNQSNIADAIWCIDTLPGHHINAYSDATGYTSGSRLNVQEWNHMQYTIPLIPGYVPNASAGKIWVYVYVTDWASSNPLPGATVSLSGNGLSTQTATTGSSGGVSLQWPNQTTAYINVAKAGYTTGSKVITTTPLGPDIVYISIHQGTLTATLTPTGTGTPATTIGPYGTPGASGTYAPGYTTNEAQKMMDFLAANGLSLVELCVLVTILALLGVKLGK